MKVILSILLIATFTFAKDFTYFLPQDSSKLKAHIENLIKVLILPCIIFLIKNLQSYSIKQ